MDNSCIDYIDSSGNARTLLNIAQKIDANSRFIAKKMHKFGYIYALYGALDGLNLSYSTMKYIFDLLFDDSDKAMHSWLISCPGAIVATTITISLINISSFANYLNKEHKNYLINIIIKFWPYFRDSMKGLKNAYKGFRSGLQVIQALQLVKNNYCILPIVPIGICLGIVMALNKILLRYNMYQCKTMIKNNEQLFLTIQQSNSVLSRLQEQQTQICRLSLYWRSLILLGAMLSGLFDGIYLYAGMLLLSSLLPPMFIIMLTLCALYILSSMLSRIYDEYKVQRQLLITALMIDLAICGKKLEYHLIENNKLISDNKLYKNEAMFYQKLAVLYQEFGKKQHNLANLSSHNVVMACLFGIKNGLAAFGAIASFIWAIAALAMLTSSYLPAALLITANISGIVLLLFFMTHAIISFYSNRIAITKKNQLIKTDDKLAEIINNILLHKNGHTKSFSAEEIKRAILCKTITDNMPQFFFQEWFEVVRSFFAGFKKGFKAVDFAMQPFQQYDVTGKHNNPSKILAIITMFSATIHGITLALRAQACGFGKDTKVNMQLRQVNNEKMSQSQPGKKSQGKYYKISGLLFSQKSNQMLPRYNSNFLPKLEILYSDTNKIS